MSKPLFMEYIESQRVIQKVFSDYASLDSFSNKVVGFYKVVNPLSEYYFDGTSLYKASELPDGKLPNQVLAVNDDGDLVWVDKPEELPSGKLPHQVLGVDDEGKLVWVDVATDDYSNPDYPGLSTTKDAIDLLLYREPEILSFTLSRNIAERGEVVDSLSFSWHYNKDLITSQSIDNGVGVIDDALRSISITGANITNSRTYKLTVSDGTNIAEKTSALTFLNRVHWGVSSNANLTDLSLLGGNELRANRIQTRLFDASANGGNFIYFAWPSDFGTPTFLVGGLVNSAWEKTTISHTNLHGYSRDYDVYRSTNKQHGSSIAVEVR